MSHSFEAVGATCLWLLKHMISKVVCLQLFRWAVENWGQSSFWCYLTTLINMDIWMFGNVGVKDRHLVWTILCLKISTYEYHMTCLQWLHLSYLYYFNLKQQNFSCAARIYSISHSMNLFKLQNCKCKRYFSSKGAHLLSLPLKFYPTPLPPKIQVLVPPLLVFEVFVKDNAHRFYSYSY